jgi:proline dehydrogenase
MLQRTWQATLIALARSPTVKSLVQDHRSTAALASRYVAGPRPEDATELALKLRKRSIATTSFYLGEYVDNPELIDENVYHKINIADQLGKSGLDVHVSVDPTQIGYQQSPEVAAKHARRIAEKIARSSNNRPGVHCLMLDMEDDSVVDDTLAIHDDLQKDGLPVAVTLQAYLRRTQADLADRLARPAHIRLVKGAFALRGGLAFRNHREIKDNYRLLVHRMLSREARESGLYPSIATHDTSIHALALELADQNGWKPHEYEFEMLFGVRSDVAADLAAQGAQIRLYVPFGKDWWPHTARRIGESPRNAWLLAHSLLRRGPALSPGGAS